MSHQESSLEVIEAVVAGGGKDVDHPAGRCLWQDGGNESEAVPLGCGATPEELGLSDQNQAVGLAVQKSCNLKKRRACPGGAATASWAVASSSSTLMLTVQSCVKRSSWGHQMLTQAWLV